MTNLKPVKITDDQDTVRKRLNDVVEAISQSSSSLPVGGSTGQVLTKASSADYDVEWANSSGGGGGGGSTTWGSISGTLSAQTDLQSALNGKANTTHTHSASQITDLSDNLRVFIQTTQPSVSGPYLWINTTGGNLQFMVEDGL